jgi:hypothetical protein
MLPILLALIVFFTDVIVAIVVFNIMVKRGHPMALPVAGFIVLAGISSAVMIYLYGPRIESGP